MWNPAERGDPHAAACSHCPRWTKAPITMVDAYVTARRHAYRYRGHAVCVINLAKLSVSHRYQHEIPADQSAPLF